MPNVPNNTINFSTLLAASVHDIKNILGTVLESLDWLNTKIVGLDDEQTTELEKTSRLVAKVNSDLMELLCFYKFENSQYALTRIEHNVAECLESQALFIQSLIKRGQVTVSVVCEEDLTWDFDQTLINTAIRNAAMNALKYAKQQLKFVAMTENGFLKIQIEDDGPGFPAAMLGAISAHASGVDLTTNSTGLGLYFIDQVAKLHVARQQHGLVELTNNSSLGGACFNLYIP